MKKVSDLDEKDRNSLRESLDAQATLLGQDIWDKTSPNMKFDSLRDQLGICCDCANLYYCRTEYERVFAFCDIMKVRLYAQDRMVECNIYSRRGEMPLEDMIPMATIIEIGKKEIGF